MPIPSRLIAATLFAMPPALALAWMPEPPPGYGPPGYGYPGFPPPYSYPDMGPPPGQPWAGPEGAKPEPAGSGLQGGPAPERGVQPPPSVPAAAEQAQPNAGDARTSVPPQQAAPPTQPGAPEAYGAPYDAPYGYPYSRPFGSMGEHPRAMPGQLRVTREVTEDAYLVRILVGDGKAEEVQVTPLGRSLAISRSADAQTEQEERFDDGRGYQRSFSYSRGAVSRRLGLPPDADLSGMSREVSDGTITLRIPRSARQGWGPGYGPNQPPAPGEAPQDTAPATPPGPMPAPAARP